MQRVMVEVLINASLEKIWQYWTEPEHIVQWCAASDDWHAPRAVNHLSVGGVFKTRMEARDGSAGFDFEGAYVAIDEKKRIDYVILGGRKVTVAFVEGDNGCTVTETFDAEDENPIELQQAGWQAILENFKKYVEAN